MLRFAFSVIGTFIFFQAHTQPASFQDCLGAIPICQQVYEGGPLPSGHGNILDFENDDTCLPREFNSIWYTFTVNNSGQFGFILTPDDFSQDYDWVLFDITDASCEDILNNPSLAVSCNAAGGSGCTGQTGATGGSAFDQQGPNCNNFPPDMGTGFSPFNELIDVQAGNTYALCIINFSETSQGYTLDFGLSADIGIFDDTPPVAEEVAYPDSCSGQEISVRFSEYIQCSTIDASNFQLNGPGGPYTLTLSSPNCDAGGNYSKEFLLGVDPPIPSAEVMSLELNVDGNTEALDLCDNPGLSASLNFEGPGLSAPLDLGPDTTICEGASLILESGLTGTHLWSDGSNGLTLEVFNAGVYWLVVNTPACGQARDTIVVSVSDATLPGDVLGNDTVLCASGTLLLDATTPGTTYLWQDGSTEPTLTVDQPGNYAVTLTNDCGEAQDEINVDFAAPITAELNDTSLCPGQSVSLDVSTSGATYLWQDGSTAASYTVNSPGIYSVTISNACEVVELSVEVQETAPPIPNFDLGNDTTLCPEESLLLELDIPGVSYLWQDGSTGSSFLVNQPGLYSVSASNECGEVQDEINVSLAEPIDVELSEANLCPGETASFDVSSPGASYLWQDGSTAAVYTTSTPGIYSVTISNACEVVELSAEVLAAAASIPDDILGGDTVLCPGETLLLELDIPGASYSWQDGSEAASYQVAAAGNYSVTVSNECGSRSDAIAVALLGPITAKLVPDTVLCPGQQLVLDVTDENASDYYWQDNSTEPVYLVKEPGNYTVLVANQCEEAPLSIQVKECEICDVYVPNAFSPNGDGKNDIFQPYLDCPVERFNLKIFNRWGAPVFETTSIEKGWDGTFEGQTVGNDVFIYVLQLSVLENGKTRDIQLSGDIAVTR